MEMSNFDLKKYLTEGKLYEEDYSKESLLKALGDADDAFIQLGNGRELIIYNPNSNNDDNADMWGDDTVFAVDKDGQEEEIDYRDIAGINLEEGKLVKEDNFSREKMVSTDFVEDWDYEGSIKKIIDELKEYQKVNPQDDLQKAINHLEYLIYT